MTIQTIPLTLLDVAPENARHGREPENVEALASNIRAFGLLTPLGVYQDGKRFKVFAGARRLQALRSIDPHMAVSCTVRAQSEAAALSIAENHQRVDMRPAEAARAWSKMISDGADVAQVGRAFGVTERFVQQRLKLAALHPPIMDALDAGEISLDVAGAFAMAPVDRQAAVWKRLDKHRLRYPDAVRRELQDDEEMTSDDAIARFVGEDAYVAAGGRVERDLFGFVDQFDEPKDREFEDRWLDPLIARRLAEEKLEAEAAKLRKQGFQFVRVSLDGVSLDYTFGAPHKTKAERAECGALVVLERWNATIRITKGVRVRGAKPAKSKGAAPAGDAPSAAPAQPQPPLSSPGHTRFTAAAGRILARTIALRPDVAMVAMTARLARMRWGDSGVYVEPLQLAQPSRWGPKLEALALTSDGDDADRDEGWRSTLGAALGEDGDLEATLGAWPAAQLGELFAFLVGSFIDIAETSGPHEETRKKAGALAMLCQLSDADLALHYRPTAGDLSAYSREQLEAFAKELGATVGKTKKATAEAVAIAAEAKGWVPPVMREVLQAPAPEPKKRSRAK